MVPRAIVCLQRCSDVIYKQPSIVDGVAAADGEIISGTGEGTAGVASGLPTKVGANGGCPGEGLRSASPATGACDVVAQFDHASFRFADADEDTLHDIDFACRRGQTTAIIGSTGSGKSTIAKMLLRLHDVTAVSYTHLDVYKRQQQLPARRDWHISVLWTGDART